MKIADGFVNQARTYPSHRIPAGIGQSAPRNTNPHVICGAAILIQEKMGNGSADAADGDGWGVGGAGGKKVCRGASRNSGSHCSDVCRITGAGEQGRKSEVDVAGLVGVEKVAAIIGGRDLPRVSVTVTIGS